MRSYMLGVYEKAMPLDLSWRDRLEGARTAGFDFVEMSIDETDSKLARLDMDSRARRLLIRDMERAGIPIGSICLSGHRRFPLGSADESIRNRSLDILQKAICLAADLGIRIIQLAGYDVYYEPSTEETRGLFESNLRRGTDWAARAGITLAFETMETPFLNTVKKCMTYVDKMASPWLQVYPDSGNISNALNFDSKSVEEDIRWGRGHLAAVHLKEALPGRFREVPFGTGEVDFTRIVAASYETGVRRFVAEFWHQPGSDWRASLEGCRKFMVPHFNWLEEKGGI